MADGRFYLFPFLCLTSYFFLAIRAFEGIETIPWSEWPFGGILMQQCTGSNNILVTCEKRIHWWSERPLLQHVDGLQQRIQSHSISPTRLDTVSILPRSPSPRRVFYLATWPTSQQAESAKRETCRSRGGVKAPSCSSY
jgi:hypothetical protein